MEEKARGIVLKTVKYGDSSIIADIFTDIHGSVSFLVRIPKSRKSALRNVLFSPLSLLELDFDYRENRKLQNIQDVHVMEPYSSLPYHPVKATIALFLAEFLYYSLREEHANPMLFDYIQNSLMWLDASECGFANYPITFLIRLTRFLGFWPDLPEDGRSRGMLFDLQNAEMTTNLPPHGAFLQPEEAVYVSRLLRMDYANMHLYSFTRIQRARVMQVLNDYYRLHVPGFPELKSMAILREVLS